MFPGGAQPRGSRKTKVGFYEHSQGSSGQNFQPKLWRPSAPGSLWLHAELPQDFPEGWAGPFQGSGAQGGSMCREVTCVCGLSKHPGSFHRDVAFTTRADLAEFDCGEASKLRERRALPPSLRVLLQSQPREDLGPSGALPESRAGQGSQASPQLAPWVQQHSAFVVFRPRRLAQGGWPLGPA